MRVRELHSGYQITDTGIVIGKSGKPLKAQVGNHGYAYVDLYTSNGRVKKLVHRLVAEMFCDGFSESLQVNHKDANRLNNSFDNLEWVTAEENLREARERNGDTSHIARKQLAKVSKKAIRQLDLDGNLVKEYSSPTDLCEELGWAPYRRAKISEVAHGKRSQAFGYLFEWVDPIQAQRSCSKKSKG